MRTACRVLAVLLTLASAPSRASDLKTNPQLWSELDVIAPLGADADLTLLSASREGEGLPNPTLWGGGPILDYRLGPWTVSAGDLQVVARSAVTGARLDVNLPLAAVSRTWRFGDFAFIDRNRIEDLVGVPGDPLRYRNRVSLAYPVTGLGPISSIFASDEVFYDLQLRQWSRNRAQVGFGVDVAPRTRLDLYFLRQDDRFGVPRALDVFGTAVTVELR